MTAILRIGNSGMRFLRWSCCTLPQSMPPSTACGGRSPPQTEDDGGCRRMRFPLASGRPMPQAKRGISATTRASPPRNSAAASISPRRRSLSAAASPRSSAAPTSSPVSAPDAGRHQPVAEVAVGRERARRLARDRRMAGQVDRVGDDRRRRVGLPRRSRASTVTASAMPSEKTAAAPAAGRDAAHADRRRGSTMRSAKPLPVPAIASRIDWPGARCSAMSPPLLT